MNRLLFENGCSIIESRRNHTESVELEKYAASSLLHKLSIFITSESRSAYFTAAVVSAVYLIITFAWSRLILYRKDIR